MNEEVEKTIVRIITELKKADIPGLDYNAIKIERNPSIFSGEITIDVKKCKVNITFCFHPHDYPWSFYVRGININEELPMNNDEQVHESIKKIIEEIKKINLNSSCLP